MSRLSAEFTTEDGTLQMDNSLLCCVLEENMSRELTEIEKDALVKRFQDAAKRLVFSEYRHHCGAFGFSPEFMQKILVRGMLAGLHIFQDFRDEIQRDEVQRDDTLID